MSLEQNKRVQALWDKLDAEGKHGHYETLFAVVNSETKPLQQAYDRAMAHNAMLREALHGLYTEHPSTTWSEDVYVLKALNATNADATAWKCEIEKVIIQKFTQSIFDAHKEAWEEKVQQLATVTAERDALRRAAKRLINANNIKRLEGKTRRYKKCCRNGWLTMRKALAQKGGEVPVTKHADGSYSFVAIEDYKGDGSPDVVLKDDGGMYTACKDYCHSGRQSPPSE